MSYMLNGMTEALIAVIKSLERGCLINDIEVDRKIKLQKIKKRLNSCCENEEKLYKHRPKPVIPVVKIPNSGGPLLVKTLPLMYVSTFFTSPYWPCFEILEIPMIENLIPLSGVIGELEMSLQHIANLCIVAPDFESEQFKLTPKNLWKIRQQMCQYIPEMYGRRGDVNFSFFNNLENDVSHQILSDYLKVANLSVESAPMRKICDRLVYSTLNRKLHVFKMSVYNLTKA